MSHFVSQKEIAAKWTVDRRTVNRWQKQNAPLHDDAAMVKWIEEHRSRLGVGKYSPKQSKAVVAEVLSVERVQPLPVAQNASSVTPEAANDTPGSTLARLEEAERIAYSRYIDSGGSERAAQVWLLVCDQKRKLISDQAKQASDISGNG